MIGGREREGEEKTLIQDEYNEGKELCKEIKKKAERERSFKSTCLRLRSLGRFGWYGDAGEGISLY